MTATALLLGFAGQALQLHAVVDGDGYMRFVREGRIVYSASATLEPHDGLLMSGGLPVAPAIRIPTDAIGIEIDLAGNVVAIGKSGKQTCGRLVLASFDKAPTQNSGFLMAAGKAVIGNPGQGLFGVIRTSGRTNSGQGISIKPLSEVTADTFTLGDIAQVDASMANIVIGPSPAIGVDLVITVPRLKAILARAHSDSSLMVPPRAIVRRKAQAIKQEDFVAAAIKAAGSGLPLVCNDNFSDFQAPLGQVELKGEGVTTNGATMSVTIAVSVDGKRINSRIVNLHPDASAQIRPGAVVKIVMKSSGVTVEVPGRARTGGMIGQPITVVTDTGSVLMGTVVGGDKVEVKL
jgi:hypothetical protein